VGGLCGGAVVAWVASRFFVSVRRTGELELLLTTPLGVETLVSEQWNVLKRFFVWPVLVMQAPLLPQILAGLTGAGTASGVASTWQSHVTLFKALSLANTFLGATALCWLGLWFGSRARTQAGAIVWTVALAKGLPSLVTLFCSVLATGVLTSTTLLVPGLYAVLTWVPELVILFFYIWLIQSVRRRLTNRFESTEAIPLVFQPPALTTA
jgi:hypothetical protein